MTSGRPCDAAGAVGDDRLQRRATGSIDPDSFTHGTSEHRRDWFERGYESGDAAACDTFSPAGHLNQPDAARIRAFGGAALQSLWVGWSI